MIQTKQQIKGTKRDNNERKEEEEEEEKASDGNINKHHIMLWFYFGKKVGLHKNNSHLNTTTKPQPA